MQRIRLLAAVAAVCLLLTGCGLGTVQERTEKLRILRYVQENEALLTDCIASGNYSPLDGETLISEISTELEAVDFQCGGSGFGSQTNYWGFFYSEADNKTDVWCCPSDALLMEDGNGWSWSESEGDNSYYVEPISGHFYYYYAHF